MKDEAQQAAEMERAVETVLEGLSAVQSDPGFEARLMRAVATASSSSSAARGGVARGWWPWARVASGACVLVGAVVLVAIVLWRNPGAPGLKRTAQRASVGMPRAAGLNAPLSLERTRTTVASARDARRRPVAERLAEESTGEPAMVTAHLEVSTNADEVIAADFAAPSQPAPPMPLTAQERRVRLMLRHGEKREMAQLDPERRVMVEGQDRAERRAFFDPPRTELDPFQGVLPW